MENRNYKFRKVTLDDIPELKRCTKLLYILAIRLIIRPKK